MANQSNAPITTVIQQGPSAGRTQNFGGDVSAKASLQLENQGLLVYPSDNPKYTMTFSISQYNRTDLNTIGEFVPAGYPGIVLPLPSNLIDTSQVNWKEEEVGAIAGNIVSGLQQVAHGDQNAGAKQVAGAAAAVPLAVGSAVAGSTGIGSAVSSLFGVSPNQFMTLLMRGPMYKRHSFEWHLSPNNHKEALVLQQIVTTLKNAMAVNMFNLGNSPVLWQYPKIFRPRIYPNSGFLYKFKPCVLDNLTVNWTPAGRASFYAGQTAGDNPTASFTMQMHLIELEVWIEGNVSISNDPDDYDTQTHPANIQAEAINGLVSSATSKLEGIGDVVTGVFSNFIGSVSGTVNGPTGGTTGSAPP